MFTVSVLEDRDDQRAKTAELARRWGMERGAAVALSEFASREAFLRSGGLSSDIALLDIALPGDEKGGLAAAMELRHASEQAVICFLTDMVQFALEGYECFPQAFLVKPISYPALRRQLDIAARKLSRPDDRPLLFQAKGGARCVSARDILFAETKDRGVLVHTAGGDLRHPGTMKSFEDRLAGLPFFRCHAAYLVNLGHVERVEGLTAFVGGAQVPISRHRKREFLDALASYLGEEIL